MSISFVVRMMSTTLRSAFLPFGRGAGARLTA